MKKFLSLVLALVMTMSLVTIGAGATEYKDLTDKSEIQYEEAVAVLNKIGVITGYTDGSFQPTGSLTRGAAAKIIVSMMIGPEAASALTVTAAPYKDVPVTNTFAAVISYCKTAGYISGYSDGTFRPTGTLTGFAFAKMLLGALGYDGKVEGFTGSGWTMNVAALGSVAGLFNDFAPAFKGNDGVTREQACQLALNTLKATIVEYVGGTSVTTGDASVVINGQRQYKTSNNASINKNIYTGDVVSATGQYYTLEFGEEHFQDLKKLSDTTTTFGRPATRWSFKNVTIDKFAKTPDYTFTAAPSGDTAKEKVRDLGLESYKVYTGTNVTINDRSQSASYLSTAALASAVNTDDSSVAQKLVDLFGNGILVEVYLDDNNADIISDIVVIRTQMMEVNTVSSKTITVKQADEVGNDTDPTGLGGKYFKAVSSVKDDDDAFADLKDCKSEDYMLVTYAADGSSWTVNSAMAPTVVTGTLNAVSRNNNNVVNGVTVGGTDYKLAAVRDDDFAGLTANSISATRKDVTLYLDQYGYATYIKDAGTATNFMVYGDQYSTLVNGKILTTLTGWDMKGNEVEINVGTSGSNGAVYGDLIKYMSSSTGNADYSVVARGTATNPTAPVGGANGAKGYVGYDATYYVSSPSVVEMKAQDTVVYGATYSVNGSGVETPVPASYTIASGVKTIFLDFESDGTVKDVYVKSGVANVSVAELAAVNGRSQAAQLYINKDGAVEAIVVKTTSSDAVSDKVLYVESVKNQALVDGVRTYTYHVWVNGAEDDYTSTDNLTAGQFATYAEKADGSYKLGAVTKTNSATSAFTLDLTKASIMTENKNLIYGVNGATSGMASVTVSLKDMTGASTTGASDGQVPAGSIINASGAVFSDLTDHGFSSMKDLFDSLDIDNNDIVHLTIVMNNKVSADNRYKVSAVAVTGITPVA